MSNSSKAILITASGNPISTFIQRRISQLSSAGLRVVIELEYNQTLPDSLKGIETVRTGIPSGFRGKFEILKRFLSNPKAFKMAMRSVSFAPKQQQWAVAAKRVPLASVSNVGLIHCQWIGMAEGYQWLAEYHNCKLMASARGSQISIYPYIKPGYESILRKCIQACHYIHCVSADMAEGCKKYGATDQQLFVNYNGITLEKFSPAPTFPTTQQGLKLISVGALMWRKNPQVMLLLMKELKSRGINASLTLVGDGEDAAKLKYYAHSMNVLDVVTFTGKLPEQEVQAQLKAHHIYLSTSVGEGLANSVMEAAATGLVNLVFDCEGMREIINPGKTGEIVEYGNLSGMADILQNWSNNPTTLAEMGANARTKTEAEFDIRDHVQLMVERYQSILNA